MEQLKQKLNELGYKEVKELDETSLMAGGNSIYV